MVTICMVSERTHYICPLIFALIQCSAVDRRLPRPRLWRILTSPQGCSAGFPHPIPISVPGRDLFRKGRLSSSTNDYTIFMAETTQHKVIET